MEITVEIKKRRPFEVAGGISGRFLFRRKKEDHRIVV